MVPKIQTTEKNCIFSFNNSAIGWYCLRKRIFLILGEYVGPGRSKMYMRSASLWLSALYVVILKI
ncbi:hypothetical protein M5K25_005857 [Dendrobium thyrsiflorum]|uniref:Uncharacterized protein n=1 Tax=Dendrobium thyrsiflorum TaxID=117978 RepID=A0ABD0VGZ1_DENTH